MCLLRGTSSDSNRGRTGCFLAFAEWASALLFGACFGPESPPWWSGLVVGARPSHVGPQKGWARLPRPRADVWLEACAAIVDLRRPFVTVDLVEGRMECAWIYFTRERRASLPQKRLAFLLVFFIFILFCFFFGVCVHRRGVPIVSLPPFPPPPVRASMWYQGWHLRHQWSQH